MRVYQKYINMVKDYIDLRGGYTPAKVVSPCKTSTRKLYLHVLLAIGYWVLAHRIRGDSKLSVALDKRTWAAASTHACARRVSICMRNHNAI